MTSVDQLECLWKPAGGIKETFVLDGRYTAFFRDPQTRQGYAALVLPPIKIRAILDDFDGDALQATQLLAAKLQNRLGVNYKPDQFEFDSIQPLESGDVAIFYALPGIELDNPPNWQAPELERLNTLNIGGWFADSEYGNSLTWDAELTREMLQEGKPRPLPEAIEHIRRAFHPHESAIEEMMRERASGDADLVESHKDRKFVYAGYGATGLFLRGNDGTVLALRAGNPRRAPIPHQLQPAHVTKGDREAGKVASELMPALDLDAVTEEHVYDLAQAIAAYQGPNGERYVFADQRRHNVGLSPDGTPYVLDGDAISEYTPEEAPWAIKAVAADPQAAARWVNVDGSWKQQYTDFESLHDTYQSPLSLRAGSDALPLPGSKAAAVLAARTGSVAER